LQKQVSRPLFVPLSRRSKKADTLRPRSKKETAVAFAGINYLAVMVAAAVALLASTAWYVVLGRILAAPLEGGEKSGAALPNVLVIVGYVVMSFMLAGLIGHLGPGQVTVANGVVSGGFVWFGFVLPPMTVNYGYSGRSSGRLATQAGNWLIVLIVIGAVLGGFGV
jgi:Protein of unknown function (DUF1761)